MSHPAVLPQHRYRHEAMATWFEIRVATDDADYAAQAVQEVFTCIDQLEARLSRYREDSEVRQLGRLSPGETLRLHPETFACLHQALELATRQPTQVRPRRLGHVRCCASAREVGACKSHITADWPQVNFPRRSVALAPDISSRRVGPPVLLPPGCPP